MSPQQREEHIRSLMPLVYRLARQQSTPQDREDAIQDGMLGLIQAVDRWQPDRGTLITFAYYRIKGSIQDGQRRMDFVGKAARRAERDGGPRQQAPASLGVALLRDGGSISTEPADHAAEEEFEQATYRAAHGQVDRLARRVLSERNYWIMGMYAAGTNPTDIGRAFGVTRTRIVQIIANSLTLIRDAVEEQEAVAA
jgi:RNA polymerase sigma factor for flagellar operon FliA